MSDRIDFDREFERIAADFDLPRGDVGAVVERAHRRTHVRSGTTDTEQDQTRGVPQLVGQLLTLGHLVLGEAHVLPR